MKDIEVDERVIDELVTGQLFGEQYRKVLLALDSDPGKWRDCALAFLAEQALRSDLSALAKSASQSWDCPTAPVPSTSRLSANFVGCTPQSQPAKAAALDPNKSELRVATHRAWRDSVWASPQAISTAALLMISFVIGWLSSDLASETIPQEPLKSKAIVSKDSPAFRTPSQTQQGVSPISPRVTPESTSAAQMQYILDQRDGFMPLDREVPPQLVELEREGKIQLESLDGVLPLTRDDGSVALVPVQMFRVVPVMLTY